jgi:homoserine kinase type II
LVRAWPEDGPGQEYLETIHDWLRPAADLAYVPSPFQGSDGRTIQVVDDRCWEITKWYPGLPDLERSPAPAHIQVAFEALATLHLRLGDRMTRACSPGLIQRIQEVQELIVHGFDAIAENLAHAPQGELLNSAIRWLHLARTVAPQVLPLLRDAARLTVPLQPVLRDARPEHFLFDGPCLTGLVDYGAMGVESVAADLARLLGEWFPDDEPNRLAALAAYQRIRPLGPSETALIGPFEAAADLLIAHHWLRWHLVEHRRFDDPRAVERGVTRGLERLERRIGRLRVSPVLVPGERHGPALITE